MKKIVFISICSLLSILPLIVNAQNSDAETGIRLYKQNSYASALPYLQRAAKAGNTQSFFYLGEMYRLGLGTEKNYTTAMNMYKRGADNSSAGCLYGLALLHYNGSGVTKNLSTAFSYAQKAADMNYPYACSAVSIMFASGEGTPKDMKQAIIYGEKAFNLGENSRCAWLGLVYYNGEDIPQDYSKALMYWTQTNVKYPPEIRLLTAIMLYEGRGTTSVIKQYPCHYEQHIHGNGLTGKTYIAEALTIADDLVKEGYDDARSFQRDWKHEYDERVTAANKVTAPQFTDKAANYIRRYNVPREMAYCGGRAQYKCIIRSNGQIDNVCTLICSVAAKADFDKNFLANMPRFVPGTKRGEPIDMEAVFWIEWVPSRNIQMAQCHPIE